MSVKHLGRAAAAVSALLAATPACATDTFAQFAQLIPKARIFSYANVNSATVKASISTAASSNTVLVSNLGTLISPSLALVNFTATASALPTLSGSDISQLFSGTITFTLLAPQMGLSGPSVNALTVTFTDAEFVTTSGASAPTLQADSAGSSTISYASDFADLTGTTAEDFALSFSGSSNTLNLTAGRLPTFTFSGSGTFAGTLPVPEPASWALMLLGFATIGSAIRSRRTAIVRFG